MKFGIDNLILWSKSGQVKNIAFQRNKINVLSGYSQTGKSTIIKIFDYCFLASKHDIPHSIINENISWYGLKFFINNKTFIIARRSPDGNKVSDDLYFSTLSEIPQIPQPNIKNTDLKTLLESEFAIHSKITMPFGGKTIKSGSKISFRYFFLFNTISDEIILNRDIFFDKQNQARYKEALPRIFDLALGIDNLENILTKETKDNLHKRIQLLEHKRNLLQQKRSDFEEELQTIITRTKEYGLIAETQEIHEVEQLLHLLNNPNLLPDNDIYNSRRTDIIARLSLINKQKRKYHRFNDEYLRYQENLKLSLDSLKPIEVLIEKSSEIIQSDIFDTLLNTIVSDLNSIKSTLTDRSPITVEVSNLIQKIDDEKKALTLELSQLPAQLDVFNSPQEMWRFIGESIGKLTIYNSISPNVEEDSYTEQIERLNQQYKLIKIEDIEVERNATIELINEIANDLIKQTGNVLNNYADYASSFNYTEKKLQLRKPKSTVIENIGSSSNHMFLHLIHFLAIHQVALTKNSGFIPTFLMIDQPSRPYWEEDKKNTPTDDDKNKIITAFKLLDDFITTINTEYNQEFQMIIFEHVPDTMFADLQNIHLLPPFKHGNALIPKEWYTSNE